MVDLARVLANERVDLGDVQHIAEVAMIEAIRQTPDQLLTNPAGSQRFWILTGFAISNPAAQQVRVAKGVAISALRDGGSTYYGMILSDGDATKSVDINSYAPGTYSIYIRFEYVEGTNTSRVFWDAGGLGAEFTQLVNARRHANWSLRIESSSPGSEWLKIGEVVRGGGAPAITDMRPFYFEGAVNASYANTWGSGNDRNADRATYGIRDFQTLTAAMRTQVEGLIGAGKRWWEAPSQGVENALQAGTLYADFVVTGYTASIVSGLTGRISPGAAYIGGNRVAKTANSDHVYTVSKTTYVDLSKTGVWTYVETNIGDPQPAVTANSIRIGVMFANGVQLISTGDYRELRLQTTAGLKITSAASTVIGLDVTSATTGIKSRAGATGHGLDTAGGSGGGYGVYTAGGGTKAPLCLAPNASFVPTSKGEVNASSRNGRLEAYLGADSGTQDGVQWHLAQVGYFGDYPAENINGETEIPASVLSIPADSMRGGSVLKAWISGYITSNTGGKTLTLRLNLDGLAGSEWVLMPAWAPAAFDNFSCEITVLIPSTGATQSMGYIRSMRGTNVNGGQTPGAATSYTDYKIVNFNNNVSHTFSFSFEWSGDGANTLMMFHGGGYWLS